MVRYGIETEAEQEAEAEQGSANIEAIRERTVYDGGDSERADGGQPDWLAGAGSSRAPRWLRNAGEPSRRREPQWLR